jgi:hypothetical protein
MRTATMMAGVACGVILASIAVVAMVTVAPCGRKISSIYLKWDQADSLSVSVAAAAILLLLLLLLMAAWVRIVKTTNMTCLFVVLDDCPAQSHRISGIAVKIYHRTLCARKLQAYHSSIPVCARACACCVHAPPGPGMRFQFGGPGFQQRQYHPRTADPLQNPKQQHDTHTLSLAPTLCSTLPRHPSFISPLL